MNLESLKELATTLRDNEAFQKALDGIRKDAVDSLCSASPTDADTIRTDQATVRVVDDIRASLERDIALGSQHKPGLA